MIQEIKKIKTAIELVHPESELKIYEDILNLYKKFIEVSCKKLRRILLNEFNLFISNPVFIMQYSYGLNLLSNKNYWLDALILYNQIKYLVPLQEINYDTLKKMTAVCDSLSVDPFFERK